VLLPSKFFQVLPNGSPGDNQMLKTYKKLKQNVNKRFVKLNKIKIKKRNFEALLLKFRPKKDQRNFYKKKQKKR
jgi:hypothetical protein